MAYAWAFPANPAISEIVCRSQTPHGFEFDNRIRRFNACGIDINFAGFADFVHLLFIEDDDIFGNVIGERLDHGVSKTPDAAASLCQTNACTLITIDDAFPVTIDAIQPARSQQEPVGLEVVGGNTVITVDIFEDRSNFGIIHIARRDAGSAGIDVPMAGVQFVSFFEDGDEKSLGIIFPWRDAPAFFDFGIEAHSVVLCHTRPEPNGRNILNIQEFEGIASDELMNNGFILFGIERTRRVDDSPADLEQTASGHEDAVLELVL